MLTLSYSRKAVRLLVWQSTTQIWAELHERAFRRLGGTVRVIVLDNLTLLRRGAPVDATDDSYGGTPLGWALYAWGNATEHEARRRHYYEVVALLIRAGAELDRQWYSDDDDRQRGLAKARSDPRMMAALRGDACA